MPRISQIEFDIVECSRSLVVGEVSQNTTNRDTVHKATATVSQLRNADIGVATCWQVIVVVEAVIDVVVDCTANVKTLGTRVEKHRRNSITVP